MNKLVQILQQVPDLEIVNVEEDFMKTEIQFRVNSNWWTNKLELLTRSFPDIYFTKRYITQLDKFGFRWSILKLGQMDEEMWKELAERVSFLLFETQTPIKQPKPQPKPSIKDPRVKVTKRLVYDTEGDNSVIGDMIEFPIPHVFNELNRPQKGRGGAAKIGKNPLIAFRELFGELGNGAQG